MAKADPADRYKKEVELLKLKLNDYESMIAKLKSDDSTQDAKIENLNKLHGQKIRALMQSIQELKKQNASIRALNKENNRSKLIEKLKTELVQQEIAIQALRDIINDNNKCDEQIISYLNKGPPRIRPLSREEMKIQIRKLNSRLGIHQKSKGDQAVDDLESLLNPSRSQDEEFKLIDPLQNEKIVELVEQIQNLQLDLRAKDSTIEHLRSLTKKLQEDLFIYKNNETEEKILGFKLTGIESEKQGLIDKLSQHSSNVGELQHQLESAILELRAKNEMVASLKKRIEEQSATRGSKDKEYDRLRKELSQAMSSVKHLENENGIVKERYERLLEEVRAKDIEIEEAKIMQSANARPHRVETEDLTDYKDLEIAALQEKINDIMKQNNLPETFMAAERAETDKHKMKLKELYVQVADLQEEVEFLQQENLDLKKMGAAKALSGRIPDKNDKIDYKVKFEENAKELVDARVKIKDLERKLLDAQRELKSKIDEKDLLEMNNKRAEDELNKLNGVFREREYRKKEVIEKNQEVIENVTRAYSNSIPKIQVAIGPNFNPEVLLRYSDNTTSRLVKK